MCIQSAGLFRKTLWALLLGLVLILAGTLPQQASAASATFYNNQANFEAAIDTTTMFVDTYSSPPYPADFDIYSNAVMSAFLGEVDYYTTGFRDRNIIYPGLYYCAGCNGSFRLGFQTTSLTEGGVGVYGVGVNVSSNLPTTPYYAYITYGDGSTDNIALPVGASFFGVTAPELIQSIHFGLSGGGATRDGSFTISRLVIAESLISLEQTNLTGDGYSDGWVLERAETYDTGYQTDNKTKLLRVGDDRADRQYKAILSFDTSAWSALDIQSGTLLVKPYQEVGDPFSLGDLCMQAAGGYFAASWRLERQDFEAAAAGSSACASLNDAGWYEFAVAAGDIDTSGWSQFRLFFASDDNDNRSDDTLMLYGGYAGGSAPVLEVDYIP
ncbi:MAG: hypothetical protein JW862_00085 [Anaerolineales bacterium]|nr:hypothetical protein [Anaerolineales bacterium]